MVFRLLFEIPDKNDDDFYDITANEIAIGISFMYVDIHAFDVYVFNGFFNKLYRIDCQLHQKRSQDNCVVSF